MYLAIAVETNITPNNPRDYRVWFLETNAFGEVTNIGVKDKEDLIQSCFTNYQLTGRTNWRVFRKGSEKSEAIEITDFVAQGMFDNTHFGELPTLEEFQTTLDALKMNLKIKKIA